MHAASRESNQELVSDFMVNSILKNTQRYFCRMHGMCGRVDQITTNAKLLDIMQKSYGFNADLIEAIN